MAYNTKIYKSTGTAWEEVKVASDWSLISNKPTTFVPSVHEHPMSEIIGLVSAIDDINADLVNKLDGESLKTVAGNELLGAGDIRIQRITDFAYNPTTHIVTFTYDNGATKNIDLPLEQLLKGLEYDEVARQLTLTLQNGTTQTVPLNDLVVGLASETYVNTQVNTRVEKNATIVSATKPKITYDAKGLVTGGADLIISDIPLLPTSKITSGTFDDARIPELAISKITSLQTELDNRITKTEYIDPNAMAYFDYAGSVYGAKYSLLANAWEHSLTVDPLEISADSSSLSPRGTPQYPNGETEGVIIPQGITSIGDYAFYNWTSNNQPLVIPNSVTSIGEYAFQYWTANNQQLVIPNSVTSIGPNAFMNWTSNNQSLIITQGITSIGDNAFANWNSNNQLLVIPNSVTTVGQYAFRNWLANNQSLVIPNSVTTIGQNAFQSWTANNNPLIIPNSVTSISDSAFYNWSANNQPLIIPNSVTEIGANAFMSWKANNKPLVIPNSVTSIGDSAFYNWLANTHPLVIPNSVTSIEAFAFRDWKLAEEFIMESETPPTITSNSFDNTNNAPFYVPDESVDDYKTATNWVSLANRIFPISDKAGVIGDRIDSVENDVRTIEQSVNGLENNKVDKVTGKALSTNDYANTDKQNVEKIPTIEQDILDLESDKVDKVAGMGLSTNDFTNNDKNKLDGIEAGAEVNEVNSVNGKQGVVVFNQDDIGDGATYKRVLQAEKNTWDNKQDELIAGDNITIDPTTNVISASGGGVETVDWQDVENKPELYDKNEINSMLDDKVDKVAGMGLSTNDFTTTEKNKLSGIQAGAQVNAVTAVAGRTGAVVLAKADVGLGSLQNYAVASKTQAEAGTSNALYMTPLRTKELITVVMGDIESALDAILGV